MADVIVSRRCLYCRVFQSFTHLFIPATEATFLYTGYIGLRKGLFTVFSYFFVRNFSLVLDTA